MDDFVNRLARELPDTDRNRYDIAYQRGRAQARSSLLFGGLALGAAAGSAAMYLLDPSRGRGRRTELRQRVGSLVRSVAGTAQGRGTDLRNRVLGAATEIGLPGTPRSHHDEREDVPVMASGVGSVRPGASSEGAAPPRAPSSAGAHAGEPAGAAREEAVAASAGGDR